MANLIWYEDVGDGTKEPGQANFSIESGSKRGTYLLKNPEPTDIENAITQILGGTTVCPPSANGKVQRTLPAAHPQYPWLYASKVSIHGTGVGPQNGSISSADPTLEAPPLTGTFQLYQHYWFDTDFTPRPYQVISDQNIVTSSGSWYNFSGVLTNFTYNNEWSRFLDWTNLPQEQWITAQQGQMQFVTASTNCPNGGTFSAKPRVYLPNTLLKMVWYQVPYRFVTSSNSYLQKYQGLINQNAFFNYKPGQLLYLNFMPQKYTPPVQGTEPINDGGTTVISTDKLCNVELNFLATTRDSMATDLPAAPANKNYVVGGHNLQPWLQTRMFYYAQSSVYGGVGPRQTCPNAPTSGVPSFLSCPFEQIFSDPDAGGQC